MYNREMVRVSISYLLEQSHSVIEVCTREEVLVAFCSGDLRPSMRNVVERGLELSGLGSATA